MRPRSVAAALFLLTAPAFAADMTSTAELKQLFKDGNYKDLTPKLTAALAAKGPAASQYNRYDLLMIKGEVALRTKTRQPAIEAFKDAAKAATKPDDAAAAEGLATLIKQSGTNLKYTPKVKGDKSEKPEPIDIVEVESRKTAFAALIKDMEAIRQPKVDAVRKTGTIEQVTQVAKEIADLRPVEIAGTGSSNDSRQMTGDLGNRALEIVNDAVEAMNKKLGDDLDAFNKAKGQGPMTLNQLMNESLQASNYCQTVRTYCKNLQPIFGDTVDFKVTLDHATKLATAADRVAAQAKEIQNGRR